MGFGSWPYQYLFPKIGTPGSGKPVGKCTLEAAKRVVLGGSKTCSSLISAMTSASRKLCATSTRVCFLAANTHLHEASVFLAPIDDPGVTSKEPLTDAVP